MWRNKGIFYRIIALTIAFAIFGIAIFIPILSGMKDDKLPGLIALYVYLGIYVVTVVGNEIFIFLRRRGGKR